jgi:hypothetical protein
MSGAGGYIGRRICRQKTVKRGCAREQLPHSSTFVSSATRGRGEAQLSVMVWHP